jgi:hypothetical protein
MAKDIETLFHETWLGEVQPIEGLTFSVPVLADAHLMVRLSPAQAQPFYDLLDGAHDRQRLHSGEAVAALPSLVSLMCNFLGWREHELSRGHDLPEDLVLRLADEGTQLRPTFAIARPTSAGQGATQASADLEASSESDDDNDNNEGESEGESDDDEGDNEAAAPKNARAQSPLPDESTPASRAGEAFQILAWEISPDLDLDKPESETSAWHYPPVAKMERLLRETRVPIGLLCNGKVLRLLYCPHGESTGWLSFPIAALALSAGRDLLSALHEILHADRVLGGIGDRPTTLELLQQSRERQADVTTQLGGQLLEALHELLAGFEAAAVRDGHVGAQGPLQEAMRVDGNHVYEGLLTVMLRLVFALYAEDRGLLPNDQPIYAENYSATGLYEQLESDRDFYGDTMDQRFGAWPRLCALFRALYFGVSHGDLQMPPHRGQIFNPERFAFLEGCMPGAGAPIMASEREAMQVPSLSDAVVYRVLRNLLYLQGQRLSYRALDEEQLGSVYEGLMGYAVERRTHASVCLKGARVWVSAPELLALPPATRARWLQDAGLSKANATRLAKDIAKAQSSTSDENELENAVLDLLIAESVSPQKRNAARESKASALAQVEAGRLVIQPGEERRRTSSHYTPRSLSGPIVRKTLEPLLAAMRKQAKESEPQQDDPQPSSSDLLNLKICDPAMGSGAFLVESCRFLADQLVAAWVREGKLAQILAQADGTPGLERDPIVLARRMVAQRCLYGVDKNPLAVELGKLSLWLLTLARGQTFTFLDHCLKCGDSLVGLTRGQILALDWAVPEPRLQIASAAAAKPEKAGKKVAKKAGKKASAKGKSASEGGEASFQTDFFADQTKRAFAKASIARHKLADLAGEGDQDAVESEQHELHVEAERELERLRDAADIILSAYFFPDDQQLCAEYLFVGKKPSDKDRQTCLVRLRDQVNIWMQDADMPRLPRELDVRRALVRELIRPFHWELEFPEIFEDARVDSLAKGEDGGAVWMDAVVGNPPFLGGKRISTMNGDSYLTWLTSAYRPSSGGADIAAYFFRRAHWLLGEHGTLGLIATNTIGQGDTRTAGLQALAVQGGRIYDATRDMKWPVKGANVSVSIVHVAVGTQNLGDLKRRLDGKKVRTINSQLRAMSERNDPVRLSSNAGRSFVGTYVLGQGFTLTPDERETLIAQNAKNSERIFAYLGGEELNSSPTQSHHRYVIDFGDMSLEEAERWPDLIKIVREKVKPERDKLKDNPDGRRYKATWWQFGRYSPSLYAAIRGLPRCLACSQVSKHSVFAFQPTHRKFAHTLNVFPLPHNSSFGVLQSRIHERWARMHGSSMRNDLRYTPSDCFETFAFPPATKLADDQPLAKIAKELYETRAAYLVANDIGLTKAYNALKDPELETPELHRLRELHESLDREVLKAYGRDDIAVPAYCGAGVEELARFEDEVLEMLFAENERQAKAEAKNRGRA